MSDRTVPAGPVLPLRPHPRRNRSLPRLGRALRESPLLRQTLTEAIGSAKAGTGFQPGIAFDMPEDEYHAVPALSYSGIRNLLISPLDFYLRCRWLNPDFRDEPTDAMSLGKAYHCRIVEGREAFDRRYAAALDPADFPRALRTLEDIRAALPEEGSKGGTKTALIARLFEHRPDAMVWDTLVAAHEALNADKILLPPAVVRKIELAAAMIEKHPYLGGSFSDGLPEVSVFWTDPELGLPMKMRCDYLKATEIVELKTFGNPFNKSIDRAVTSAMAAGRYHVQAMVYQEGIGAAKAMIRQRGRKGVRGEIDRCWLARFAATEAHSFLFIFQSNGLAPVARGYRYPAGLNQEAAKLTISLAKRSFAEHRDRFGKGLWLDVEPIRDFDDAEFPLWMTEA